MGRPIVPDHVKHALWPQLLWPLLFLLFSLKAGSCMQTCNVGMLDNTAGGFRRERKTSAGAFKAEKCRLLSASSQHTQHRTSAQLFTMSSLGVQFVCDFSHDNPSVYGSKERERERNWHSPNLLILKSGPRNFWLPLYWPPHSETGLGTALTSEHNLQFQVCVPVFLKNYIVLISTALAILYCNHANKACFQFKREGDGSLQITHILQHHLPFWIPTTHTHSNNIPFPLCKAGTQPRGSPHYPEQGLVIFYSGL